MGEKNRNIKNVVMGKSKEFYKFLEHERKNKWGYDCTFMEAEAKAVGRVYILSEDKYVAYIEGLHVSENERLKTIGSELLNKLIEKCKTIGAKECMLWCLKNSWEYYWYQRLGFEYWSEYPEDGYVWMCKKLKED